MNFKILSDELKDPKYASMTNEDAAIEINLKNIASKKPISKLDVKGFLLLSGIWFQIQDSTTIAARTVIDVLDPSLTEFIDITEPSYETMLITVLDDLQNEPFVPSFTEAHKTAILGIGVSQVSRADQLNLGGVVSAGQVQAARAM